MTKRIKVLVVDDSAFYRTLFSGMLSAQQDIEVIGSASDPFEAREKIKQLNPDVLTLDIEMPRMDGISFLEKIMTLRPMPVIMLSSLTQKGAEITLQALSIGAVDCLLKPSDHLDEAELERFSRLLCERVRMAALARISHPSSLRKPNELSPLPTRENASIQLIAFGSSTGGVEALNKILPSFPSNMPPIVMAQHMPAGFTESFARRLHGLCSVKVREAEDGVLLRPGIACLAPGGRHLRVERNHKGELVCRVEAGPTVSGHCPSVDVLFESVATALGAKALGVILTGMGSDGAEGMLKLRQAGAYTLGQNEASCTVWGMPRAASKLGALCAELEINQIAAEIHRLCSQ
ncbi:MAG: chemotaxis response regulator protein-glutamate methylesterase [Rickettsiales bacterium]|nr:chemotaxis response regulator protein-glutamate methylesterase [Rickettsiales bacterium]